MNATVYDYIIVGAGTAGCVLAEGLSRDRNISVLVIEAGGPDRSPWIHIPAGYGMSYHDRRVNWRFYSEPDPGTDGRRSYWPRGKVVGGSGSINALIWCRGLPGDFDDWEAAGATGWGWDNACRQYEAMETRIDARGHRAGHGPIFVTDPLRDLHPATRHYFAMASELGLPVTDDWNGAAHEGITRYPITTRHGRRWSTADAFLRPALKRRNLTLVTRAFVERVEIAGRRATGITARTGSGRTTFHARREVILAAGTVNSPRLLQLSGIGPGGLLQAQGIETVLDNPNVGGHLQDHLGINYYYRAREKTLNDQLGPPHHLLWQALRWLVARRGPLGLSVNQCGGFLRSRPDLLRPDLQVYLNPITYTLIPDRPRMIRPDPWSGFILSFQPTRPGARGRIDIASPDLEAAPRIAPNYLGAAGDLEAVVAGGRLMQAMARTAAIQGFATGARAPDITTLDDDGIIADFRARCGTVFHPVGTCRMGRDAGDAVVDSELRVFGIDGLRVADASCFPNITSGNTNAPVAMLAARAVEHISRRRVPASG